MYSHGSSHFNATVCILETTVSKPNVEQAKQVALWRRTAQDLVDRMTKSQAIGISLLLLTAAAGFDFALDSLTHFDFVLTAAYMIPVGFVAWVCGFGSGLFTAVVAVLIEGVISYIGLSSRHALTLNVVPIIVLAEFTAMSVGAFIMSRLRLALEQERELSRRDHLTGLSNLRGFWEELETEVERMSRDKRPLTVVYMDVDDFKQVNDALGHDGGDEVLRAVGFTLRDSIRAIDTSARVGGDEFAIVLPNADEKVASIVVERIRSKFATMLKDKELKATLSIGVAVFHQPPAKAEATMMAADRVMYEAKHLGKNQIAVRAY